MAARNFLKPPAMDGGEGWPNTEADLLGNKRDGGRPFRFPSDDGGGLQVRGCSAELKNEDRKVPDSSVSIRLEMEKSWELRSKLSSAEARLLKGAACGFDARGGTRGTAVAGQLMALRRSRATAGVFFRVALSEGVHSAGSNCWIQGCFSSLATEARLSGSCGV